jgi:hypothetical protein
VLCIEYADFGRRIVVDALSEQERTGSEGECHDVRGARLTMLDGRLWLVVVGIFVIVVAGNDGEQALTRSLMTKRARHTTQ